MVTAPDQPATNFRNRLMVAAGLGVVALAVYVWALFTAQLGLLMTLGSTSFCILLLCPLFVAYQAARLTLQIGSGASVGDGVRASLRRCASLLFIDALFAIPILVMFSLYLQIAITNIMIGVTPCEGNFCPPESIAHTETFIPQAISVLIVALGLWGLNLLACVLGAWLVQRWRRVAPATSGTILALVVTVAIIYALLSLTSVPQLLVDVAAALLPYLLAWGAWHWLPARTEGSARAASDSAP